AIVVRTRLPGGVELSAEHAEIRLPVLHLDPRGVILPTETEVQRQVVCDSPVILEVEAVDGASLSPGASAQAAPGIRRKTEHEIGLADQSTAWISGILSREPSLEVDVTSAAAVAGIERIQVLPQNLASGLHHVTSPDN